MRFSSPLLFASSALALSHRDCILENTADLAAYADCGYEGAINQCFSLLQSFAEADVRRCFLDSGCSAEEAAIEAQFTISRCEDMSRTGELKKRYRAAPLPRADTTDVAAATTETGKYKNGEKFMRSTDCFSTGTKSTTECPLSTSNNRVKTVTCFPTVVTTSECAPGLLCTLDSNNADICMELHDSLDVGGIVIAIVFGVILALTVGAMTFMCCKDRSEQKRLVAKAEATALARAATKKKKAQQDRAPLMRNVSGGTSNPNPFQDQPRV